MASEESKMLVYVALADLARSRGQRGGSARFLVLAGAAACRAGWPAVAERCRELVLAENPHHLIARWPSLPEALRDAEFSPFLKRLERFCSLERGEHILRELGERPVPVAQSQQASGGSEEEFSAGQAALARLAAADWGD